MVGIRYNNFSAPRSKISKIQAAPPGAGLAPVELKRELYRHIVTRLAAIGIRPEDIQIAVTENYYEDWYAGRLHDE